jgi:FtsZ-binding cell division protein ZapB
MAADTIEGLREELRVLKIELAAVKQSRDQYQSENGQMKKQIASYVKKLKAQE